MRIDKICAMVQVAAGMRARHPGFNADEGLCAKLSEVINVHVWEVRWGGDAAYLHLGNRVFIQVPFNPVEARSG